MQDRRVKQGLRVQFSAVHVDESAKWFQFLWLDLAGFGWI
jgi:hypothetical protein